MSAAVPWITVLTARRSPSRRVLGLPERSSGIERRRPIRVFTIALLLRPLDHLLAEGADRREAFEVAGDEFLALLARDVEPVGEAEPGEAVDDPEVDHLRLRALTDVDLVALDLEDLGGGRGVDVFALAEDLFQDLLVGDVGEDPELDLAVVGGEQPVALFGDEAGADGAADLGPDRDVLQVRVGAGEAAGGGRGLVEGGVDASGLGVDQLRQRVEVGVLQLRQLTPLLDLLDDRVLVADLGEDAGVGREAGFAAPLAASGRASRRGCGRPAAASRS